MNYAGFRLIPCMTVCSLLCNGIIIKMVFAYHINGHKTICLSAYFFKWAFQVVSEVSELKIIRNLQRENNLNVAEMGKKFSLFTGIGWFLRGNNIHRSANRLSMRQPPSRSKFAVNAGSAIVFVPLIVARFEFIFVMYNNAIRFYRIKE